MVHFSSYLKLACLSKSKWNERSHEISNSYCLCSLDNIVGAIFIGTFIICKLSVKNFFTVLLSKSTPSTIIFVLSCLSYISNCIFSTFSYVRRVFEHTIFHYFLSFFESVIPFKHCSILQLSQLLTEAINKHNVVLLICPSFWPWWAFCFPLHTLTLCFWVVVKSNPIRI